MKHVKLFEQFVQEEINEAVNPKMPALVKEPGERFASWNASQGSILSAIRKMVSETGKKALVKAYFDDVDLVNQKTGKTIHHVKVGEPIAMIAAAVNKWAEANAEMFEPKNKSIEDSDVIEVKSDTRAIVAVNSYQRAEEIKKQIQDTKAGIKVRVMPRNNGAKIYIDTTNKEALEVAIAKVKPLVGM